MRFNWNQALQTSDNHNRGDAFSLHKTRKNKTQILFRKIAIQKEKHQEQYLVIRKRSSTFGFILFYFALPEGCSYLPYITDGFGFCLLVFLAGLPFLIIETSTIQPYQRGFYCDDDSIRYPLKSMETINDAVLCAAGILIAILAVSTISEICSSAPWASPAPFCYTLADGTNTGLPGMLNQRHTVKLGWLWELSMLRNSVELWASQRKDAKKPVCCGHLLESQSFWISWKAEQNDAACSPPAHLGFNMVLQMCPCYAL